MLTVTIDQSEGISVADIQEQAVKKMCTGSAALSLPSPRAFFGLLFTERHYHYLGAWNRLAHTKTHERLIRDLLFEDAAALVAHTE